MILEVTEGVTLEVYHTDKGYAFRIEYDGTSYDWGVDYEDEYGNFRSATYYDTEKEALEVCIFAYAQVHRISTRGDS